MGRHQGVPRLEMLNALFRACTASSSDGRMFHNQWRASLGDRFVS